MGIKASKCEKTCKSIFCGCAEWNFYANTYLALANILVHVKSLLLWYMVWKKCKDMNLKCRRHEFKASCTKLFLHFQDTLLSDCGYMDDEKMAYIETFTYWVEGVVMCFLGFGAIITNMISIYVFLRYVVVIVFVYHSLISVLCIHVI